MLLEIAYTANCQMQYLEKMCATKHDTRNTDSVILWVWQQFCLCFLFLLWTICTYLVEILPLATIAEYWTSLVDNRTTFDTPEFVFVFVTNNLHLPTWNSTSCTYCRILHKPGGKQHYFWYSWVWKLHGNQHVLLVPRYISQSQPLYSQIPGWFVYFLE